jgi:error-prone DNA polymerase
MGFWSPATIVADARRHDVVVLGVDINASGAAAVLEGGAVRMGLSSVRSIGADLAERIAAGQPYASMEDLVRRTDLTQAQLESLATAGAFGNDRRGALWASGAVAQGRADRLPGIVVGSASPELPAMTPVEETVADLWAVGLSPDHHPLEFVRPALDARHVVCAIDLPTIAPDRMVWVAGVVTHRQRPATAQGITFLNLEDETGLINVVCSREVWGLHRRVARAAPALIVHGRLERYDGVVNVVADRIEPLPLAGKVTSRDFR